MNGNIEESKSEQKDVNGDIEGVQVGTLGCERRYRGSPSRHTRM